jgi:hypothetical protein
MKHLAGRQAAAETIRFWHTRESPTREVDLNRVSRLQQPMVTPLANFTTDQCAARIAALLSNAVSGAGDG